MTLLQSGAAGPLKSDALNGGIARAHDLTFEASLCLGLSAEEATRTAAHGGLVLDGHPVSITSIPLSALMDGEQDVMVLSISLGHRLADLAAAGVSALMAHAPALLALHDASLGCDPEGGLVLHRVLRDPKVDGRGLADAVQEIFQLAQVIDSPRARRETQ